jgi:hypothetical protein
VSTQQPLVNAWIGPVSEEPSISSATCGSPGVGATEAYCSGSYCDNMYLFCGTLPRGFSTNGVDHGWTFFVSEENNSPPALCPSGTVVDGIRATGGWSDNVSVHCTGATFPAQGTNCSWSPWFSDEQGLEVFQESTFSAPSAVATGVKCSGSYCDNMSYFVCEPKCQSQADCGSGYVCGSKGVCTDPIP